MKLCHRCGREVQLSSGLQRTDSCPVCLSDLKCCLNCRFFDPHMSNQCREPQVDPVLDKDKANFCELFQIGEGGLHAKESKDQMLSTAEALFRKK